MFAWKGLTSFLRGCAAGFSGAAAAFGESLLKLVKSPAFAGFGLTVVGAAVFVTTALGAVVAAALG